MAELAVRTPYMTPTRAATLALLKFAFPVWGVLAPVAAIVIGVVLYFALMMGHGFDDVNKVSALTFMLFSILVFIASLLTVRWLSNDQIEISKDGIRLPVSPLRWKNTISWQKINKVAIKAGTDLDLSKDWQKACLQFFTESGVVTLGLFKTDAESVEKLLLAIEMWGTPNCQIDAKLQDLKYAVSGKTPLNLSFTDMWEDELSRRFCATAFVPLEPGQFLRDGTIKVVRHLALGGLSAVYLCQLDDHKLIVLKEAVVADDTTESAQAKAREMLDREAAVLLKLAHPNIVKVSDYFSEMGRAYLMLEYINGQDLRALVKQNGPQRESIVIAWALEMANILKFLHEQDPPLIHRDFTPDNLVLCEDGSIVLIDFGAANEYISNATGTFVGKHAYIAPEQFRGKAVVQSDIYAFGCTLYFLLTGVEPEALSTSDPVESVPFGGATAGRVISKQMREVVVSCTQIESGDRYQSAAQLIPVFRQMLSTLPTLI